MTQLEIRNLTPNVGAEVLGVESVDQLAVPDWQQLGEAFFDRGVLVFRDLDLDVRDQHAIVEGLFAGGAEPIVEERIADRFAYVSNTADDGGAPYGRLMFHSDMMWSELAWQVASLYAVEADQPSVPTVFANAVNAWDSLPSALRSKVDGLHVRHESGRQGRGDTAYEEELLQPQWAAERSIVTPVGRPHEVTGRTILYVCEQQTREIVELPGQPGWDLLDELFEHLYDPSRTYSHDWRVRDLVVWDNVGVQHGRPNVVTNGPARTLRKIHAPGDLRERIGAPGYAKAT
jgi:alpha-ketoglutarate-dependent taurine dioxygenase